jgi:hypothetical protein
MSALPPKADIAERGRHVRFGSEADIASGPHDVRFAPNSGHSSWRAACPLCAKSGLMHCNKKPQYSITSSARTRNAPGIVNPSALAVSGSRRDRIWSAARPGCWTVLSDAKFCRQAQQRVETDLNTLDRKTADLLVRHTLAPRRSSAIARRAPADIVERHNYSLFFSA